MNSKASPKRKQKEKPNAAGSAPDQRSNSERIARRIARAGLCSRRQAEIWIADGRVKVNGKLLETPAFTVTSTDQVEVDGKIIGRRERTRLWLFHKISGTVTTNRDPEGRKTIFDDLPEGLPRLITVGRLDINTEGLILMTNDGGLARLLELPSTGWLRRYRVRVHGVPRQAELDKLAEGIAVDGILYGSIQATLEHVQGTNSWLIVSLREGKNREIKNVLGSIGFEVTRLIRISFGPFQLGDMPGGNIREIRSKMLREQLGEKLVCAAGADFEGPIVHLMPQITRSAKKATAGKPARRNLPKVKPGAVRIGTLDRLTTSQPEKHGKNKRKEAYHSRRKNRGKNDK